MDSDQPSSMLHVRASTMYPLPIAKEKGPPLLFPLLCGEGKVYSDHSVDGMLAITNYRLYLQNGDQQWHVPLALVELVEVREMFYLHIGCKDARSYRCTFDNNDQCSDWLRRLLHATTPPRQLPDMFAFCFKAWATEKENDDVMARLADDNDGIAVDDAGFKSEVERLGFDLHGSWRISQANTNYRLCPSYPPQLLVPACITDDTLETVARFRSSRRIPAVVWRHAGNGAVIARCSQPEVGWLGWRSSEDEDLLKAIADACAYDKGPRSIMELGGGTSTPHTPTDQLDNDLGAGAERALENGSLQLGKKVLIMDARSYTTAVANRARGGGCECPEYYPSCDIQFMNLANIHSIRKSFHALRQLCASSADQPNWWSLLEGTRWLQHMSGLMRAAGTLVTAVERDARPVLVHCSDGWDRTPQIVALAEILLDPYYRTIAGFRLLVEREWLAFGHKFADRCGHAAGSDDQNERCPVFLQWLDCVHQLLVQFPCSFQFANTFLVKLAQHTYSNLFGTFLCNTKQERVEHVYDKTFSVWRYLNVPCFKNHLYAPSTSSTNQVLWPVCNVRDLQLWSEVYIGSLETSSNSDSLSTSIQQGPASCLTVTTNGVNGAGGPVPMTKTRSYGDLMGAAEPIPHGQVRRSSDPNITIDPMKISSMSINSIDLEENIDTADLDAIPPIQLNNYETKTVAKISNNTTVNDSTNFQINLLDSINDYPPLPVTETKHNGYILNGIGDGHRINGFHNRTNDKLGFNDIDSDTIENDDIHIELEENGTTTDEHCIKYEENNLKCEFDLTTTNIKMVHHFESNCIKDEFVLSDLNIGERCADFYGDVVVGDINHNNGEVNTCVVDDEAGVKCVGIAVDEDSDNERSESKSEITLCASPNVVNGAVYKSIVVKSNETSTDTLVAENGVISNIVPDTIERTEVVPIQNGVTDGCEVCAQNRKLIGDKHFHHSRSTSGKTSRYSTPPPYTRTPTGSGGCGGGCATGPGILPVYPIGAGRGLDVDGLIPLRSDLQHRLWQLKEEHRIKEEALQRELHTTRMALIKQVCHNCSYYDGDKLDDTGSMVGSVCSTGEGQASVGESLPSDLSWEALDEGPSTLDSVASRTLWVPDHAVSRCTGCHTEFWLGRRKHHCRNCGRIFCADCSENSTPLPNEHLYNPVRVCTSCYAQLRRTCPNTPADIPENCKHAHSAAHSHLHHHHHQPTVNTQVTASSN